MTEQIEQMAGNPHPAKQVAISAIICILILGGIFLFFAILMYNPPQGQNKSRITEGLILASAAKNLITDNAVNGLPFTSGWRSMPPTKNTQAILIDEVLGVITIVSNPQSTGGEVVLILIPTENGAPLVSGKEVIGRISWQCKILSLGGRPMSDIPVECRF